MALVVLGPGTAVTRRPRVPSTGQAEVLHWTTPDENKKGQGQSPEARATPRYREGPRGPGAFGELLGSRATPHLERARGFGHDDRPSA